MGEDTPRLDFDNPRAAPIVLTIGAALWRGLAWWENVDFLLSVREERVAVTLQLILDWGWLVLIVAGIVWLLGANKNPKDTSKVHWGMVVAVGILAFMMGALIAVYATGSLPIVAAGWGGDPLKKLCSMQVDTSRLVGMRDKYRVVLICGMGDASTDPIEDTRIAISKPFTINGQTTGITAPYGHLTEASDTVPSNQAFNLWHTVGLVPKDEDLSEIKRVSDVEKHGGRIIVQPPAGALGNPAPGTGLAFAPVAPANSAPSTSH